MVLNLRFGDWNCLFSLAGDAEVGIISSPKLDGMLYDNRVVVQFEVSSSEFSL
jgi:hypothetical protein